MHAASRLLQWRSALRKNGDLMIIKKIKSIRTGGQTGVDRAAMDTAREYGIPLCGWCPKNGWAEDYPSAPGLLKDYPELLETSSEGTKQRTEWNMRDADAILTIIPEESLPSPGTDTGLSKGESLGKPMLTVSQMDEIPHIIEWLGTLPDGIELCIGGPRASECKTAYAFARKMLSDVLLALFSSENELHKNHVENRSG